MTKILGENGDTFIKIVLFVVITKSVADLDITKYIVKKHSLIYLKKDFFLNLARTGPIHCLQMEISNTFFSSA